MKKKKMKALAQAIAEQEMKIQSNPLDKMVCLTAQNKITDIANQIDSIEDMVLIDDMVQDLLKELI